MSQTKSLQNFQNFKKNFENEIKEIRQTIAEALCAAGKWDVCVFEAEAKFCKNGFSCRAVDETLRNCKKNIFETTALEMSIETQADLKFVPQHN